MLNYQFNDGGRAISKRPKQKNDCVVRAVALVLDVPYDTVYDMFARLGRTCGRGTSKIVWQSYLDSNNRLKKISFPAQKGIKRMDLNNFHKVYCRGTYIVQCAGHLTVVKDGVILDSFVPRVNACVYAVWCKVK